MGDLSLASVGDSLHDHLAAIITIQSMYEARSWCLKFDELSRTHATASANHQQSIDAMQVELAAARNVGSQRAWWKRWIPTRESRAISSNIKSAHAVELKVIQVLTELKKARESIPFNEAERDMLIESLKSRRRDFVIDKAEINTRMKEIRGTARQRSAGVGGFNFGTATKDDRSSNASERRAIALDRETTLAPLQRRITAIERDIIAVDRRIEQLRAL